MTFPRAAGILLHPTSLPGPGGIGTLGENAYQFLDTLHAASMTIWQILPLSPTGYGDSPYSALSAFAGNPFLIALEPLIDAGWLGPEDLGPLLSLPESQVDFGRLVPAKMAVLRRAFERFRADHAPQDAVSSFAQENAAWLEDFALFMAIKDAHGGVQWDRWEEGLRKYQPDALERAREQLRTEIEFHRFVQFVFFQQWRSLKARAGELGIKIVGDIPIFVAHDSVDVWAHQDLFQLDQEGFPLVVAGVPPDYFSATGQLWGNPHYRWDVMAQTGYAWWVERFRMLLRMVDIVRLDHFRGFAAAWTVPYGNDTAEHGAWVPAPGEALFTAVRDALGTLPIIAEDLGVITDDVVALRRAFSLPGMQVLHFAFSGDIYSTALPHNFERNTVVYTGTHDNDTTVGWWMSASDDMRREVLAYLGTTGSDISWDLMRLAFASVADLAIVPLQDVLRAGSHSRMNTPGRPEGNWSWRFVPGMLDDARVSGLRNLARVYGRV
ncbi:MAG TPA: 4-alpha-glucanotransferase [Chloroflexota bacterium]